MSQMREERMKEQRRVDQVIEEIERKEKQLRAKADDLKESVIGLRGSFFEDVTVNIDEPEEVIETYASIKQQAELLSERERSHGIVDKQLKVLSQLKDSPYFGRIDFHEYGEKEVDQIYIGIASLMDDKDEDFLIYDWRAPISSLYYDFSPGEVSYETLSGTIQGDMLLKRQFIINQGKIEGMFDTGLTIGDDILQEVLGNHASEQMKNIVATIQKEQNRIIRNVKHKYLVVQGVAGSGKTSAALQRVAYLMYRYRDLINENNIMLFSPNPLFNSYVANVLPELGEANMRQTTFLEYIIKKVEERLSVESPFEQMEYILTAKKDQHYERKMKSISFKTTLAFKEMIDEFIQDLEEKDLIFKDITFRDRVLMTKDEIYDYFYQMMEKATSIPNALDLVNERLLKKVQTFQRDEIDKEWVMEEIEVLDDEDILNAYKYMQDQEGDDEFYDSGMEEEYLRGVIIEKAFSPVIEGIQNFVYIDLFATYRLLFTTWQPESQPNGWEEIKEQTINEFNKWQLSWEDATPYVYFKDRLLGDNTDRSIKYLFVDEAQDYTAFQLAYLKYIFPYTRMTFLGDVNQAIFMHTQDDNPLQAEYDDTYEKIVLTKSYRSTKQIVEFTKHFSPDGGQIEPFERAGEKPKLIKYEQENHDEKHLLAAIHQLMERGQKTIAIVCKTFKESKAIYGRLKDKIPLQLMTATSRELTKGVLVLPIYIAKGIEFDAVIIPDASKKHYQTEWDQSIFYTACTRAMHELVMLTYGEETPFIKQAPKETYEVEIVD